MRCEPGSPWASLYPALKIPHPPEALATDIRYNDGAAANPPNGAPPAGDHRRPSDQTYPAHETQRRLSARCTVRTPGREYPVAWARPTTQPYRLRLSLPMVRIDQFIRKRVG
jgi:hypothetical protein